MTIKGLELENFKSLEKANIDFGTITVVIGSNGTGKSSILQALGLLKQSRQQKEFVWNGPEIRSGGFADIVSFGATKRQIRFILTFEAPIPPIFSGDEHANYSCKYSFIIDNYGAVRQEAEYILPEKTILSSFDFKTNRGSVNQIKLIDTVRLGYPGAIIGSVLYVDASGTDNNVFKSAMDMSSIVIDSLEKTYTVPVDRGLRVAAYPQKIAPQDFRVPEDVASFLVYKQDARERVSKWASEVLDEDLAINFHRLETNELSIEILRKKESINIAHEGAGLQNLLWPLAQLAVAPEFALVAIEEPEVHLHPSAQVKLSDVLTNATIQENKQLFITTQSEHLLLGFLTQVAENKLDPKKLSIYYCEKVGSSSQPIKLEVNKDGTIEGGLRGFIEANFEEMSRYLQAQIKEKE
jgi:AAA15 family ATPase/GTPase